MRTGRFFRQSLERLPWHRTSELDVLDDRAEALRALAALLRTGLSLRAAAESWTDEAPESLRPALIRLRRRLRLGEPVARALAGLEPVIGDEALSLASIVEVAARIGGDVAAMIEGLAASVSARRERLHAVAAAVAGMRLSGRMVAALPLFCLPLLPAARAPLTDPIGALLLVAGLVLVVVGMRWMSRLVPVPPTRDDAGAVVASLAGAALRAGAGLHVALETITLRAPDDVVDACLVANRLVRLGATWPVALSRCNDPALAEIGRAISRAHEKGLPAARALDLCAIERRARAERELEAAVRRAPILMVVPLATCVLPAFVLLGIGPFMRGLSLV